MSVPTRHLAAAAAAILVSVGGSAALAQQPGPSGSQQQPDLGTLLHLRSDQMNALHTYQSASRPTPDQIARIRSASPQALAAMTTPQRLDKIGGLLTTQLEVFRRNADATRAFYATLSPDQQRTFDRITSPPTSQGRRPQY